MKEKKTIIFPLMRDFKTIPPTIAIINYLSALGYNIEIFTYHTQVLFNTQNIKIRTCSKSSYPVGSIFKRTIAKSLFHLKFYSYFFKIKDKIDFIWLGAWDVWGLNFFKGNSKIIYHYHELEVSKYNDCRKADYLIVPEENRGWITYFQAKLKRLPYILPNIPYYPNTLINTDSEIEGLKTKNRIVIMYSGLLDNKKRNLKELVSSLSYLPDEYILVLIPSFNVNQKDKDDLKHHIRNLNLNERVFFLKSRVPPKHLDSMSTADIGVGFYSPTSLNNIYAAPNRLYEFVNNNTPVILPNFPSFKSLSKEYPFAVNVADPNSPKDIAAVIIAINKNSESKKKSIVKFKEERGNYENFAGQIIEKVIEL
ncbi:glycosyltransferase [Aureibaculum sp. 2210JD6-5]|uniref:glycosyltransferase n=1 Tax=Aureibaculum sp. 2210JD6-5 TaxID=3103957 RepID=UPI002AAE8C75|nr:glycosyltransferase [Aureibaculum sp. 2210JD6-5]MDY7394202.1 glycosyltransferase [Aureibaculum sp. 2210JD6-5]